MAGVVVPLTESRPRKRRRAEVDMAGGRRKGTGVQGGNVLEKINERARIAAIVGPVGWRALMMANLKAGRGQIEFGGRRRRDQDVKEGAHKNDIGGDREDDPLIPPFCAFCPAPHSRAPCLHAVNGCDDTASQGAVNTLRAALGLHRAFHELVELRHGI